MLSTIHSATQSWTGKFTRGGDRQPIYKPSCIVDYTRLMGGVDLSDQLMSYYHFLRKTCKWWRKLWVHLLNMCIMNAFVLNRKFGQEPKLAHFEFRIQLAKQLLESASVDIPDSLDPQDICVHRLHGKHYPEKIPSGSKAKPNPRACIVCKITKTESQKTGVSERKKYTSVQCDKCRKPMCVPYCFKLYHTQKNYREILSLRDLDN